MGVAKWKATSDFRELERDYAKLMKSNVKLLEQNKKLADQSKRASEEARRAARNHASSNAVAAQGANKVIGSLKAMAGGYLSINAAVQLVISSLKEKAEIEKRALEKTFTVAQSQAAVAKNIGDVTDKVFRGFLAKVGEVKDKTGFESVVPLNLASSKLLSAVQGDRKETIEILKAVTPLFKDTPDELPIFASALGDIKKFGKMKSGKETAALMLAIQGQARFETLEAFKEFSPTVAAGVASSPDAPRDVVVKQTAALFAAIGGSIADKDAALTKTAVANLEANLAAAVPGKKTTLERLQVVRQDPALQEEVARSGFRGAIKPGIKRFLSDPQSDAAIAFRKTLPKMQGSMEAFEKKVRQLERGTEQLALTNLEASTKGAKEKTIITNTIDARREEARRIARRAREITQNEGGFFNQMFGFKNLTDRLTSEQQIRLSDTPLKDIRRDVKVRRRMVTGGTALDHVPDLGTFNREDRAKIVALNNMLKSINKFLESRKEILETEGKETVEAAHKTNQLLEKLVDEQKRIGRGQENVNKGNANAQKGRHTELK